MKYSLILISIAVAGFSLCAVAQVPTGADTAKDATTAQPGDMSQCCPGCRMVMGKAGQSEWCKEMMAKAGISEQMMSFCQAMCNAPMERSDPAMLMGWEKDLKLTDDQKAKLADIAKDARDKALAVLTDDQRKVIESMPADKMTLREMRMEMHKKMMPVCKEMMKEGKKCGGCPMMQGMHGPGGTMQDMGGTMHNMMDKAK
ncbi:MAG: hypothetical protein WC869_09440 [Phycisphaerae bacterium]|jgi:hypothetical protein